MNILRKFTKEYIKKNRRKTIVSILSIILTSIMITSVILLAGSFKEFMVNLKKKDYGDWEASFCNVVYEKKNIVKDNLDVTDMFVIKDLNYAFINNTNKESDKALINLRAYDKDALDKFNIIISEGKLPENQDEVVVSEKFANSMPNIKIGDKVSLNLGKVDGDLKDISKVSINSNNNKEYKVVGIIKEPKFEKGKIYGLITYLDDNQIGNSEKVNVFFNVKNAHGIFTNVSNAAEKNKVYDSKEESDKNIQYNSSVLNYMGVTNNQNFKVTLYGVSGVLIGVISICSIIVIYNSFNITITERKKEFGILSSIGATKSQIKKIVTYEGLYFGLIAIPIGIIISILGIACTLKAVDKLFVSMFSDIVGYNTVHLGLVVSIPMLIVAAIFIMLTILISVLIPAIKACRVSPIEAIRGSEDIKIKSKKLRTPKIIKKLFGVEGNLAYKNLKRSKKKYRATVISLVISIVLFITFNGYIQYLFLITKAVYQKTDYDFEIMIFNNKPGESKAKGEIFDTIKDYSEISKLITADSIQGETEVKEEKIDKEFKDRLYNDDKIKKYYPYNGGNIKIGTVFISYDDNYMKDYLKSVGIDKLNDNEVILVNHVTSVAQFKGEFDISTYKKGDEIKITGDDIEYDEDEENIVNQESYSKNFKIAKTTDKVPYGFREYGAQFIVVSNKKTLDEFTKNKLALKDRFYIEAKDVKETEDINKLENKFDNAVTKSNTKDNNFGYSLTNIKADLEKVSSLETVVETFLYGFIALISLIGVSNVFNTISTNILVRKKEFANLKSIGMSDRSFNKMLDLECILYGTKALLIGIPLGIGLCYTLARLMSGSIGIAFRIPTSSIIISIIGVYLVTFLTMFYARSKTKKDNIIDDIKDENI